MQQNSELQVAAVPMRVVGPMAIVYEGKAETVSIPLATYESPLWPSTARGARVSRASGGIKLHVVDDRMTRSIVFEGTSAADVIAASAELETLRDAMAEVVAGTSRFCRLKAVHQRIVGRLWFLRLEVETGDAAGHNMVTLAADRVMQWLLARQPSLRYVSISGNYCTDKKVSAVNGILGRGKSVVAELVVSEPVCRRHLRSSPEAIASLHVKKNLIGSNLAGGIGTANAHVANLLLAFYLATGQDAANIVEGSQAMVHAEVDHGNLYFSLSIPNIIVGTVGNGKDFDFVRTNLAAMGCEAADPAGTSARRLAAICGGAALCAELSLLAAQTNPGELMRAHEKYERRRT